MTITDGRLRVVIADDERPARAYLRALLDMCEVDVVGEAVNGTEAVALIEREAPDLALLDLQMPELDGLEVVQMLRKDRVPLIAFVTAYDEYAVRAFDVNAVDYLLKPVDAARLGRTLTRARERLEARDVHDMAKSRGAELARIVTVSSAIAEQAIAGQSSGQAMGPLRRIPVRRRDDIIFIAVDDVAALVADGELLRITTLTGERHTITHRLKDIEARLSSDRFVRLSRSALVNADAIVKVSPMPGGTYVVTLKTGQQLSVSRLRARAIRDELLRL